MPRNAEVIRQWTILKALEASRRATIDDLARQTGVTTRTIRRDLDALQEAGFALFDELHDGKKCWTLEQKAFRRLDDTGFTLAELSALYFSRTLVECLSGTPFERDVRSAFEKLSAALTPGMRQFLDRMPLAIQAKPDPGTQSAAPRTKEVAQLLEATLQQRRVTMRYDSFSSNREKALCSSRIASSSVREPLRDRVRPRIRRRPHLRGGPHCPGFPDGGTFRGARASGRCLCAFARCHPGTPEKSRFGSRRKLRATSANASGIPRKRSPTPRTAPSNSRSTS